MIQEKTCQNCGRTITWRKKWEKCWDEVKYCSARCRREKPDPINQKLENTILDLLAQRSAAATICPSEAARALFPNEQWHDHMEQTRQAARRLVAKGKIDILQKGRVVDPSTAKGPIRLRRKKDRNEVTG